MSSTALPLIIVLIIAFVILFVLLSAPLRSIINVYNFNGLRNDEVAAHNVPTSIDQGTYLGQIPELNKTSTKESRDTEKVDNTLSTIERESTSTQ